MDPSSYPDFDALPQVEGMPQGCAWGIFDKDGRNDLLGTLNFLTPQIVQAAAAEVKTGISISLKQVPKNKQSEDGRNGEEVENEALHAVGGRTKLD